jgi:hypothetical protein
MIGRNSPIGNRVKHRWNNNTPARILIEILLESVNAEKAIEKNSMKNNSPRNISDVDRVINKKEDKIVIM